MGYLGMGRIYTYTTILILADCCEHATEPSDYVISWVAEQLLASQEELFSVELAS
jgi:hypothetical protein